MSERVHPAGSPPADDPENPQFPKNDADSDPPKPKPPPGTYVIQVPKDQIYRVPPPENARLYQSYCRRSAHRRRSPCCRCLAWTFGILLLLLISLAATAAILYFVFQPKLPNYSLDKLSIKGFNLNNLTNDPTFSPEFDVTVRADNPNKHIGIYYRAGSSVTVSFSDVTLCNGVWPIFYQGTRNVTVFQTALTGSGIRLSSSLWKAMVEDQGRGMVPLEIDVKVPVKIKFGAVTSWTFTVKVRCDVTVDKLTADSRIVSKTCSTKVDF